MQAGEPRSYDFVYTITESGSADGVTNDSDATRTITFRVADDGVGHLTVTPMYEDGVVFSFTNTYDVDPVDSSVTDQVDVTKVLTGRDLNDGEFDFELLDGEEVVASGSNDASGKVTLSSITYTRPGTHNYTIREVGAGTTEAGVTYDGTTYAVETVVKDNGDGTLGVTHTITDSKGNTSSEAVFNNTYDPADAKIVLNATKVLSGATLNKAQFTFQLADDKGTTWSATNNASGQVFFPEVTFDATGTYTFVISEVNDGQANVTYDTAEHKVSVEVTDDLKGNLVANVAYEDGVSPVFVNTYTKPTSPATTTTTNRKLSKTGDIAPVVVGGVALVALAATGAAGVARKRNSKREDAE